MWGRAPLRKYMLNTKYATMVGDDEENLLFTQSRMLKNAILGFIYGTSGLAEQTLKCGS